MAKKKGVSIKITERYARVLRMLTHESNLELAIAIMLKQVVRYRLRDAMVVIKTFEERYGMNCSEFEQARADGIIANPQSPEVEKDGRDWHAAESEREMLVGTQKTLEKEYPGLQESKMIVFNRHWKEGTLPDDAVSTSYAEIASGKPPSQ